MYLLKGEHLSSKTCALLKEAEEEEEGKKKLSSLICNMLCCIFQQGEGRFVTSNA